jgi:hypothetical protein
MTCSVKVMWYQPLCMVIQASNLFSRRCPHLSPLLRVGDQIPRQPHRLVNVARGVQQPCSDRQRLAVSAAPAICNG